MLKNLYASTYIKSAIFAFSLISLLFISYWEIKYRTGFGLLSIGICIIVWVVALGIRIKVCDTKARLANLNNICDQAKLKLMTRWGSQF